MKGRLQEWNDVRRRRRPRFCPHLKPPPHRRCQRPNPRDADQEKRRGNMPKSPPPTATGNAGQQQAESASSTMKTSPRKGKGRWRGEEGRDQKKPQSPSPPTSPPPAEPAPQQSRRATPPAASAPNCHRHARSPALRGSRSNHITGTGRGRRRMPQWERQAPSACSPSHRRRSQHPGWSRRRGRMGSPPYPAKNHRIQPAGHRIRPQAAGSRGDPCCPLRHATQPPDPAPGTPDPASSAPNPPT